MRFGLKSALLGSAIIVACGPAAAESFNIPPGSLDSALDAYSARTGIQLLYSEEAVKGARTRGATGDLSVDAALSRLLSGTGFVLHRHSAGSIAIVPDDRGSDALQVLPLQLAQATPPSRASVETVTVTSSKLGGADVQSIPIAITALSQEQLTAT